MIYLCPPPAPAETQTHRFRQQQQQQRRRQQRTRRSDLLLVSSWFLKVGVSPALAVVLPLPVSLPVPLLVSVPVSLLVFGRFRGRGGGHDVVPDVLKDTETQTEVMETRPSVSDNELQLCVVVVN